MKDNRGQKNCLFLSGSQEREEELQLFRSSEFQESMGSKRPSWVGILGIWDFALSENSMGCGVVDMCQCSRKCLVKFCLSLRMDGEQFSQLCQSLDAQQKTMISSDRGLEKSNSP
jgi:hypothetical protein